MKEEAVNYMKPELFRVEELREETQDTFTLDLKPTNQKGEFSFRPGQFNMLYLFGVGEVPISISGDPASPTILRHTIRKVGAVTSALRGLQKGQIVGVRGPFGSEWPLEACVGRDVLIVTGGIGLAPLRPIFYQILAQRKKFGYVALLYGARTPEDILFREELEKWRSRFDLQVRVTVDKASQNWYGTIGVVTRLIAKTRFLPEKTTALICGPEIMMHFAIRELQEAGIQNENIFISMERNMKCALGFCGHCQYGSQFICKDGPVFNYKAVELLFNQREV